MAKITKPDDLILPIPESVKEQDLYKSLQDYTKNLNDTFADLEDIESITAGSGITDTSNTFSIDTDGTSIQVGGSGLEVIDGGVDHDSLANTHNLTTDIDHDQLTNFTTDEHFIQSAISIPVSQLTDFTTNLAGTSNTTAFTPDADYEPATKKYVDDNKGDDPLSNVIFTWSGTEAGSSGGAELASSYTAPTANSYFLWNSDSAYETVLNFKFKKIAGISTITVYARLFNNVGGTIYTAFCNVDIGGKSGEVSSDSSTPAWATSVDIDLTTTTALVDGTVYNGIIQLKNEDSTSSFITYLTAITLIAS